jgi:predicted nucleic acid-binding Zn ribbon protein
MKKKTKPLSLGAVLKDVLPSIQKGGGSLDYLMLCRLWRETVGETIAMHTCPASVHKDILSVHVASSVWMQQLHFLRDTILEKLNLSLSSHPLKGIRFKIGHVPGPKETDEPLRPLNNQSRRDIDQAAAVIADPEVRTAFKDLMGAYLKNKQDQ